MKVDISAITIDERLQSREAMNDEAVAEYAEALVAGKKFDPVMCFEEGSTLWLVEGFHRIAAHKAAGIKSIDVECRPGTFREAWVYSLGTNDKHGVRRTNADKRKVVLQAVNDAELGEWPSREIAAHCSVSHAFVNKVRDELERAKSGNVSTSQKSLEVRTAPNTPSTSKADGTGTAAASVAGGTESAPEAPESVTTGGTLHPVEASGADTDGDPSADEQKEAEAYMAAARDNLALVLLDEDDPLKAVCEENLRLKEQIRVLESRIAGLMNEKNAAIRAAKAAQKKK